MVGIRLKDVCVSYFLRRQGKAIGGVDNNTVGAQILIGKKYIEIPALRSVNLEFREGDRIGLVGINGSGKSTLLKLCSSAVSPQSGVVEIKGRVSPQFSLGAGLKGRLTGRQNTELKCLYLGIPQGKIADYIDDIKELSGLGGYFELPIDTYSAGMRSRLIMSLLRLVHGEILIMDEWINAVDPSLNVTVGGLQADLINNSKILVLASHSRRVLEEWVEKIVWLHKGEVREFGNIKDVYPQYQKWINK